MAREYIVYAFDNFVTRVANRPFSRLAETGWNASLGSDDHLVDKLASVLTSFICLSSFCGQFIVAAFLFNVVFAWTAIFTTGSPADFLGKLPGHQSHCFIVSSSAD